MLRIQGYCDAGHKLYLFVDEDGLVMQPDECPVCMFGGRVPSLFRMWLEMRKLRRAVKKADFITSQRG